MVLDTTPWRCDSSVGITTVSSAMPRRAAEHLCGKGCRTTDIFGAGELLFIEEHPDRPAAARRERQIKGWTRAKKLALIAGDTRRLHELARRRAGPQPA